MGPGAANRLKALLAAGAVAGTLGGWALIAEQNAGANANPAEAAATPQATMAALVSPSATSVSGAQLTLTPAQEAATGGATSTQVVPGATVTAEATPTPVPTAAPTQSAPTNTPQPVTTTKSSQ